MPSSAHDAAQFSHQPIHFTNGQFSGQTIRLELLELQQAYVGRKFARVDRRPLDPPPIVTLKLWQIFDYGTNYQTEENILSDKIVINGLICTADLFLVSTSSPEAPQEHVETLVYSPISSSCLASSSSSDFAPAPSLPTAYLSEYGYESTPFSAGRISLTPEFPFPQGLQSLFPHDSPILVGNSAAVRDVSSAEETLDPVVHHVDGYPITESSNATQDLVGSTFVQPIIIELGAEKVIMFVFPDLAVKSRGSFILRYRIFDIFSQTGGTTNNTSVQAECFGGRFTVYSTKEFPGLRESTELTKRIRDEFGLCGARQTEAKRLPKRRHPDSVSLARAKARQHDYADEEYYVVD